MKENPFKLKVVGGTDFEKKLAEIPPQTEDVFTDIRQLTNKWAELMESATRSTFKTTEEAVVAVQALTAEELYWYLSAPFIDEYPEYTAAVLNEVYQRSLLNDFSPQS